MVVLSLFDGISCGMVALERANIKVDKYYSSEIDKYAIQVSERNYPNIIRLGDVTTWRSWNINWNEVDLLIGGSPCQGFSNAGNKLNFEDPRSKLFFVYVEILEHLKKVNPNIKFLLENVKMKKEWIEIISSHVGIEPIEINSALLSAQNRKRLYWCNWQVKQPKDKGILLKDVIHEKDFSNKRIKTFNINPSKKGINGNVYSANNEKSPTLTTNKGEGIKISVPIDNFKLSPHSETGKIGHFKNGGLGMRLYSINNKTVTLVGSKTEHYLINGYIRKLTPVECERLQTLPDNYTDGISDAQRYKCLGNGWTIDVIAHILSSMDNPLRVEKAILKAEINQLTLF